MNTKPTVLLAMAPFRRSPLLELFEECGAEVLAAGDCRHAGQVLNRHPDVGVVVTDLSHPDGNWSDLLRHVVDVGLDTRVVVCSPEVDERLWAEVFWRGAYDLLVEPYNREQVQSIVETISAHELLHMNAVAG
jgi:DNA-binding NtrC family response regulator